MNIPQHVAIIMDGNGRWAADKGRPRTFGHLQGARAARRIIQAASLNGIKHLTLFTFSTENWQRPEVEINFLMQLLSRKIKKEQNSLSENNIRFRAIGDLTKIPVYALRAVEETIDITAKNTGMQLTFALNYGGRQEIVQTTRLIINKITSGELNISDLNEDIFDQNLPSNFLPDPDLIIRTSGECRLSNFFLWQSAYSEISIVEKFWPDYNENDFNLALNDFSRRTRKFGQISQPKEKIPISI